MYSILRNNSLTLWSFWNLLYIFILSFSCKKGRHYYNYLFACIVLVYSIKIYLATISCKMFTMWYHKLCINKNVTGHIKFSISWLVLKLAMWMKLIPQIWLIFLWVRGTYRARLNGCREVVLDYQQGQTSIWTSYF